MFEIGKNLQLSCVFWQYAIYLSIAVARVEERKATARSGFGVILPVSHKSRFFGLKAVFLNQLLRAFWLCSEAAGGIRRVNLDEMGNEFEMRENRQAWGEWLVCK